MAPQEGESQLPGANATATPKNARSASRSSSDAGIEDDSSSFPLPSHPPERPPAPAASEACLGPRCSRETPSQAPTQATGNPPPALALGDSSPRKTLREAGGCTLRLARHRTALALAEEPLRRRILAKREGLHIERGSATRTGEAGECSTTILVTAAWHCTLVAPPELPDLTAAQTGDPGADHPAADCRTPA